MKNLSREDLLSPKILKRVFLIGIKYGPSIMAITCCLKIHLLSHSIHKDNFELSVNVINWLLNLFFLGMFYIAGKYFHYCWKHQSLCRIALWGYVYYIVFIVLKTPHEVIHPLSLWYLCFVIVTTISYKSI